MASCQRYQVAPSDGRDNKLTLGYMKTLQKLRYIGNTARIIWRGETNDNN